MHIENQRKGEGKLVRNSQDVSFRGHHVAIEAVEMRKIPCIV